MKHGFLLIDKPSGPTSHDVVAQVRKRLCEPHMGHLGTLDPAASGLLVLAVGSKALKVIEFFSELSKEYVADVVLGFVSSTYDGEGVVEAVPPKAGWNPPDLPQLKEMIRSRFVGKVQQVPPAHSAVHVNGKRAYDLARQGKHVALQPRMVEIEECEVVLYEYPRLTLRVKCGSGTYIRSLVHDLGELMRCGGYLSALRRTRVGEWSVEGAEAPDTATWRSIIPLKEIMKDFPCIELTDAEAADIQHGRKIERELRPDTIGWHGGLPICILIPAKDGSRMARPRKVL